MTGKKRATREKPAMEIIEEAVSLVRENPMASLAYCAGTIPFLLGFLFYWAEMSRGAFAHEHLAGASAGIGLLFIWMKCWQSVYMSILLDRFSGQSPAPWTPRRVFRMALIQAAIQPSALFIRPISLLITLPYGWVRAFYEKAILYGDGRQPSIREVIRRSVEQARLFPRQNHAMLCWLTLAGLFVWLNVMGAMALIPALLKIFMGIETELTKSIHALTNSTFFVVSFAGTYLCLNPVTKAAHVLRCFYGESLQTGEDLKLEIRRWHSPSGIAKLTAILLLFVPGAVRSEQPSAPAQEKLAPATIDRSVNEVLNRREFAWRMPRQTPKERAEKQSWFVRWMDGVVQTIRNWLRPAKNWITSILDWIFEKLNSGEGPSEKPDMNFGGWTKHLRWISVVLVIIAAVLLGYMVYRRVRERRRSDHVDAEAIPATPDLNAEEVSPAQLPEQGWLDLAREMQKRGDLRLALRALYLAGLAHLGARELISIARHKSNREYIRELARRARDRSSILDAFGENVRAFERAWYGLHEVDPPAVQSAEANMERIRSS